MSGFGQAAFGTFPYGLAGSQSFVVNWFPRADLQIERLDYVTFDVLNPAWQVVDVRVSLLTPTSVQTVWTDAAGFTEAFVRGSTRLRIPNGYRFIVRRKGGWPGHQIHFGVTASDLAGEVVTGHSS